MASGSCNFERRKATGLILYASDPPRTCPPECIWRDRPCLRAVLSYPGTHAVHAQVTSLYVPREQRAAGLGSALLYECARRCSLMFVDDMTDRFGRSDNLYLKCGFLYTAPGFPEMSARASVVRKTCSQHPLFRQRHGWRSVTAT